MKNINIPKKSDIQIFVDINNKSSGFVGTVKVYDLPIYVDTRDGTGYEQVVEKLSALINKFVSKFHFVDNVNEDTRQDVILLLLEGIPKFDPRRNTKLSTFLETWTGRRLINEVRDKSRAFRNATFLNISTVCVTCDCGHTFCALIPKGHILSCEKCGKVIDMKDKLSVKMAEIGESSLFFLDTDDSIVPKTLGDLPLNDYGIIGNKPRPIDEEIILKEDLASFLEDEDPQLVELVNLIYFEDYSINLAAERVGMSNANASIKLKNLKKRRMVRELFGR